MRLKLLAAVAALGLIASPALAQYKPYKPPKTTYTAPKPQQGAYQNYGKTSTTTSRPMTNTVSGYVKKDGTYVAPYARSR